MFSFRKQSIAEEDLHLLWVLLPKVKLFIKYHMKILVHLLLGLRYPRRTGTSQVAVFQTIPILRSLSYIIWNVCFICWPTKRAYFKTRQLKESMVIVLGRISMAHPFQYKYLHIKNEYFKELHF